MSSNLDKEIEVRFLNIDKEALTQKLRDLNAEDLGEDFLQETIFYDKELTWKGGDQRVRIRRNRHGAHVSYKHNAQHTIDSTTEIEFVASDPDKAHRFLEALGLVAYRQQEKYRHTFVLDGVTIDIDTWPQVPPYVELEGDSEEAIKNVAGKLGLDWAEALTEPPGRLIKKYYGLPVMEFRYFTFKRIE